MISIFGEKLKSQYTPGDSGGLCYTDSEYNAADSRKTGVVPGKIVSALLVNSALKQYCAMSYIIVDVIKQVLLNAGGISGWSTSDFDDLDDSKIDKILNGESGGPEAFISYIARIKNIINNQNISGDNEFFAVMYARDYEKTNVTNSISARLNNCRINLIRRVYSLMWDDGNQRASNFVGSSDFTVLPNTLSITNCFNYIDGWLYNNGFVGS